VTARKKRLEWNGMIVRIMSTMNMSKKNNELSLTWKPYGCKSMNAHISIVLKKCVFP
jgi:hypothetical protein